MRWDSQDHMDRKCYAEANCLHVEGAHQDIGSGDYSGSILSWHWNRILTWMLTSKDRAVFVKQHVRGACGEEGEAGMLVLYIESDVLVWDVTPHPTE
jgi:hypothetical protein